MTETLDEPDERHQTIELPQFRLPHGVERSFRPLGVADEVTLLSDGVRLRTGSTTVEVTALASGVFRVGVFADGRPVDFASEAVHEANRPPAPAPARVERRGEEVVVHTEAARARVLVAPVRVAFEDAAGAPFGEDEPALGAGHMVLPPDVRVPEPFGPPARLYKRRRGGERYFGCGERTGGLDKTGSRQVFWNSDPPAQHTESLNNLYTSIPFVLALDADAHAHGAWGLFVDNAGRVAIDLARRHAGRVSASLDCG
ncbi:MAG TPA: hypothetical protein VE987_10960, partial [Polyangiaceae bacterium]|nr:hypothetical protein [Polyangiaceae bacterium]